MNVSPSAVQLAPKQAFWWGITCGLTAAVGYTACNSCLRAVTDVDPFLVCATRTIPTLLLLVPVMLMRIWQGHEKFPTSFVILALIVTGLGAHVAGNGLFQYALFVIGLALAVPLSLGSMIISGALLGRLILHEPITIRMLLGLAMLIGAVSILSCGTKQAADAVHRPETVSTEASTQTAPHATQVTPTMIIAGLLAGCSCGFFYALLGATIRRLAHGNSIAQTLSIVSGAGLVALLAICLATGSWREVWDLSSHQWWMMLLAGIFNALSFMALTHALQLISLVYVHGINASQATMAAIAGVLFFGEAVSPYLFIGLLLTVLGLLVMAFGKVKGK